MGVFSTLIQRTESSLLVCVTRRTHPNTSLSFIDLPYLKREHSAGRQQTEVKRYAKDEIRYIEPILDDRFIQT